jgi:hypothetical protein
MKSSLAAALIVLQLATAGLVVVLLVRRNGPAAPDPKLSEEISALVAKVQGAVNQERLIIEHLDELRRRSGAGPQDPPTGVPPETATRGDRPVAPPASPFPAASAALGRAKQLEKAVRDEIKKSGQNVGPLKAELDKAKGELIDRGNETVIVVGDEVNLQPFEKGRDPLFIVWLLDEVVPAFSARAQEEAFRIARGALVRSTNEAPVKAAAARALRRIDDKKWVKEVLDVVVLGSADEVDLRASLLGLFADSPRPEAVDVCIRFMEDARYPPQLRTKAIMVIEKQDSGAVNPALRKVLFEEPSQLMKTHALDALWERLKNDPDARKKLLEDVLASDPAQMQEGIRDKAKALLETPKPEK